MLPIRSVTEWVKDDVKAISRLKHRLREDEPIFTSLKLAKNGGKEKKVLFIKAHRLLHQESMNTPNKQYTQH